MPIEIQYEKQIVYPEGNESVLEAFERSGIEVPSSCRVGVCHFCLLKATDGSIPKKSQEGLDDDLRESGHFKSCVCYPEGSLTCEPAHSASFRSFVAIDSIERIGEGIVKVTFKKPKDFDFRAGQFVTFRFEDGHARSYSLASLSSEDSRTFVIHVRKIPNGKMSGWFHDVAQVGESIWMEGPKGKCTYKEEHPEENLLLVGTGTGMAPLYAITLDALHNNHRGKISVIQGGLEEKRLYLTDEFEGLSESHLNIDYSSCVLKGPASSLVTIGDLRKIALDSTTTFKNLRIFLCGDPGLVRHLKKHFFLAGASLKNIHADPFIGTDH